MKKPLLTALGFVFVYYGTIGINGPTAATGKVIQVQDTLINKEASPGRRVFIANCAPCHALTKDAVGPALNGVLTRWNGDTTNLKAYIRNSSDYELTTGDPYVTALKDSFYHTQMPFFPDLSDSELNALIIYING